MCEHSTFHVWRMRDDRWLSCQALEQDTIHYKSIQRRGRTSWNCYGLLAGIGAPIIAQRYRMEPEASCQKRCHCGHWHSKAKGPWVNPALGLYRLVDTRQNPRQAHRTFQSLGRRESSRYYDKIYQEKDLGHCIAQAQPLSNVWSTRERSKSYGCLNIGADGRRPLPSQEEQQMAICFMHGGVANASAIGGVCLQHIAPNNLDQLEL